MLYRHLDPKDRAEAIGHTVTFTVMRDGGPAARKGLLTRHANRGIWIGARCYHEAELLPSLRLPDGVPAGTGPRPGY